MHATLCRLLSRAPYTLYYQKEGPILPILLNIDLGDLTLREWLIEQALEAYTLDKMNPVVRGFLQDCDRCLQLENELAEKQPELSYDERRQQALAMLEAEQSEKFDEDDEENDSDGEE